MSRTTTSPQAESLTSPSSASVSMAKHPQQKPQPPQESNGSSRFRRRINHVNYAQYTQDQTDLRETRSLAHWEKTVSVWAKQQNHLNKSIGKSGARRLVMDESELHDHKLALRTAGHEDETDAMRQAADFWSIQPTTKRDLHYTLTRVGRGQQKPAMFQGRPRKIQEETQHPSDLDATTKRVATMGHAHIPELADLEIVGHAAEVHDGEPADPDAYDELEGDGGIQFYPTTAEEADVMVLSPTDGLDRADSSEERGDGYGHGYGTDMLPNSAEEQRGIEYAAFYAQKKRKPVAPGLVFQLLTSMHEHDYHRPARKSGVAAIPSQQQRRNDAYRSQHLQDITPLEPHEGARILFNTTPNHRESHLVRLTNTGGTVIYYHWRECERDNSLGRAEDTTKRFFLDIEPGSILPGASVTIQIRYLSHNSGVFSEDWELVTHPTVAAKPQLLSLCGVTEPLFSFDKMIAATQREFEFAQVEKMVRSMLLQGLALVSERPPPPPPAEPSSKESFLAQNPHLCTPQTYREDIVHRLYAAYERLYIEVEDAAQGSSKSGGKKRPGTKSDQANIDIPPWSYDINDLFKLCNKLPSDDEQERAIQEVYALCDLFVPTMPAVQEAVQLTRIDVGVACFRRIADGIVETSTALRQQLGLRALESDLSLSTRKDARSARAKSSRATSSRQKQLAATGSEDGPEDPVLVEKYRASLAHKVRQSVIEQVTTLLDQVEPLPLANISFDEAE